MKRQNDRILKEERPRSVGDIRWTIEKAREFQKNIYFCFIDYAKAFDCVDHNKLWKILKEMGIPDHLTCLLRNLYAGQEATFKVRRGGSEEIPLVQGKEQRLRFAGAAGKRFPPSKVRETQVRW